MNLKESIREKVMLISSMGCAIFVVLLSLSVGFYPGGGRRFDKDSDYFNFFDNFISDLGRDTAINLEDNTVSQILFIIALTMFSLIQIYFFVNLPFLLKSKLASLILSIIGSTCGCVSAILCIALTFNPYDVNSVLHNKLIYSGAPILFVASLLVTIAMFVDKGLPKFISYVLLSLVISFGLFAILTGIGSAVGGDINWTIRIVGHTVMVYFEGIIFGLLTFGIWKHVRNLRVIGSSDLSIQNENVKEPNI